MISSEIAELHSMFVSITKSSDAAQQSQAYAEIERLIFDNALGCDVGSNAGWMPVRVQP